MKEEQQDIENQIIYKIYCQWQDLKLQINYLQ